MDINNFGPFYSDTWGSVSDWVMVLVTAITAYYLWKTLRSQMVVQKLQQKTTLIENEKYRKTILPDFDIHIMDKVFDQTQTELLGLKLIMSIDLISQNAMEASIIFTSINGNIKSDFTLTSGIEIEQGSKQEFELELSIDKNIFEMEGLQVNGELRFTDMIENRYKRNYNWHIINYASFTVTHDVTPTLIRS